MSINWSSLNNLTSLELNTTAFNDSTETVGIIIDNADTVTSGYLGLGILIVTFIVVLVLLFRDDGDIKMDIARSIMISSGFTLILGIVLLILDIISSFTHVMWFFVFFLLSLTGVIFLKKKGL